MGMIFLLLKVGQGIDVEALNQKVDNLENTIMIIERTVRFHLSTYWIVATIVITGFLMFNWIAVRKVLERKSEEYIERRLEELIAKADRYKKIYGRKHFNNNECNNSEYFFSIGSEKLNIKFDNKDNYISIAPINGDEKLDYKAEVVNGDLRIEMKNFEREKHEGIEWKITYLDE